MGILTLLIQINNKTKMAEIITTNNSVQITAPDGTLVGEKGEFAFRILNDELEIYNGSADPCLCKRLLRMSFPITINGTTYTKDTIGTELDGLFKSDIDVQSLDGIKKLNDQADEIISNQDTMINNQVSQQTSLNTIITNQQTIDGKMTTLVNNTNAMVVNQGDIEDLINTVITKLDALIAK